ncbi:helix-turn-helix transcriptional regulator [Xanthobacter dioxanivorans]|uniref:Helix-turn-helix transcriptional regulator n=1 Tax=Xanthobacter dioxanivorans TaxID=2528964 RepID=A0A974PPG9_9HYPH|nr:AraC family transcriptional regulator [Xanthobacter dioxanivorans]QRG07320.1 helix-turn-helix transcriptional regulator [Xanthobacter dioxanivorans]
MKHVEGSLATATAPPVAIDIIDRPSRSPLVLQEHRWRRRPTHPDGTTSARDITLSRWVGKAPLEVAAGEVEACHVVSIALRSTAATFHWGLRRVVDGLLPASTLLVTGPREHGCRASYREASDVLRVYLPPALISECWDSLFPRHREDDAPLCTASIINDVSLLRLMLSLVDIDRRDDQLAPVIAESVGIALVTRLVSLCGTLGGPEAPRRALAAWRLERVKDYIEAHLDRVLTLDEMARAAELSRIRFGAQFREATGVTPYAYVLHRRIAYAQTMLRDSDRSLAEIALLAGFSSQAHFTTLFGRLIGLSPGRWRRQSRE